MAEVDARPTQTPPLVALRGVEKRFGAVVAVAGVDLSLAAGEVVALVGENGAGKSTLMKILYGLVKPDAGRVFMRGAPLTLASPSAAIDAGLGMVHQHFMLFPSLTVADNVVFGAEPRRRRWLRGYDRAAACTRVRALAEAHGLAVDAEARVADLSVGERQRVEIVKLLYRAADVLILDEPTAVLTPPERVGLFAVLRALAEAGKAVVLITHKLDEVMTATDRAVVMRDGRVVARLRTRDTNPAELAQAMVGRALATAALGALAEPTPSADAPAANSEAANSADNNSAADNTADSTAPNTTARTPLLTVESLSVGRGGAGGLGDRAAAPTDASAALRDVDVVVHEGEIVGVAGVAGNGQSTLAAALMGLLPIRTGRVVLAGRDLSRADVATRRAAGLAYVPEDRHTAGLATAASVADNLIMGQHRRRSRYGWLQRGPLWAQCRALVERFAVKCADIHQPASQLSGGNQQKLVLARELTRMAPAPADPARAQTKALLIAEQPTRGVDIAAAAAIHEQLRGCRDRGHGVLLISAELSEILALADRIIVMYEGRVVATLARTEASEESLGLLMAGQA